jgi:hypothetical protein
VLPVVIAVAFLIVAKLVAKQRAEIIADLADRVAHRDTADATAAVRQLAGMSRPPIAVLVGAATSGDRGVAATARQAINNVLRSCERQAKAGERVKTASCQLAELAEALDLHCEKFSAADRDWLITTTQLIIDVANQLPAQYSPEVAIHCDKIFAIVGYDVPSDTKLVKRNSVGPSKPTGSQANAAPAAEQPEEEPFDASWRADWSNPVFRTLPPTPIDVEPRNIDPAPSSPPDERPPQHLEAMESPLAEVDSRTLLQRWLSADAANKAALEMHLAKRGFGRLSEPFVRQFSSSRTEDRLEFVDKVVTTPRVDARPWLMLLAEDRDADVRLAAVTIMATSNDATLVEKAWQAAIHDRDPRIAGLAERLRERRAATRRR